MKTFDILDAVRCLFMNTRVGLKELHCKSLPASLFTFFCSYIFRTHFAENLHPAKFNDADFKSGCHFWNLGKKGYFWPNLFQIFRMLWFCWKFAIQHNSWGAGFKSSDHFHIILAKKGILCQIWTQFSEWMPILLKICSQHNSMVLISNLEVIFQI